MAGTYGRIGKLILGLAIMSLVYGFLGFGRLPGSVLTRNLNAGIDASPLFYTEVENFREIEHR